MKKLILITILISTNLVYAKGGGGGNGGSGSQIGINPCKMTDVPLKQRIACEFLSYEKNQTPVVRLINCKSVSPIIGNQSGYTIDNLIGSIKIFSGFAAPYTNVTNNMTALFSNSNKGDVVQIDVGHYSMSGNGHLEPMAEIVSVNGVSKILNDYMCTGIGYAPISLDN